jgi:hypothetical protein
MNYRLQLSPVFDVRESQIDLPFNERAEGHSKNWQDAEFLRSWLVYDSDLQSYRRGLNWNAILGLSLAVSVSVAAWTGIGVALSHLLK